MPGSIYGYNMPGNLHWGDNEIYDRDYEPPGYVDVYQPTPYKGSAWRSYDSPSPYKRNGYTVPFYGTEGDNWMAPYGPDGDYIKQEKYVNTSLKSCSNFRHGRFDDLSLIHI